MRIEDYCDIIDKSLVFRGNLKDYIREDIITCDPVLNHQLDKLEQYGNVNIPIIIQGEPGCGKDRIAKFAHRVSSRSQKPFFKINCGYLPENEAARELFGANSSTPGLLHKAAGGSLCIENIAFLSAQTQQRVMRHIQSTEGTPDDIRFLISLDDESDPNRKNGLITPLLYHFSSLPIVIPPLRERPADILLLVFQQLCQIHDSYGVERTVGPCVMEEMLSYEWPGNIRQLVSVLEQMAFMSDSTRMDSIQLLRNCLSSHTQICQHQANTNQCATTKSFKEMVLEYEVMLINQAVEQYGSLRKAATALKISQSALSGKLMKYYASSKKGKEL